MEKFRPFVLILLFGSFWGMSEVLGGEALYSAQIPLSSVWLSLWALAILAFARALLNTPGTSSAIGLAAALFRFINAGPFICHLLGIFLLGIAFDFAATLLLKKENKSIPKEALAGILSAYGGFALFSLTITYIIRYDMWVSGGWPKVFEHIIVKGSLTAAAALVLVPLFFRLGCKEKESRSFNSRLVYSGALALTVLFWVLGRLAG